MVIINPSVKCVVSVKPRMRPCVLQSCQRVFAEISQCSKKDPINRGSASRCETSRVFVGSSSRVCVPRPRPHFNLEGKQLNVEKVIFISIRLDIWAADNNHHVAILPLSAFMIKYLAALQYCHGQRSYFQINFRQILVIDLEDFRSWFPSQIE